MGDILIALNVVQEREFRDLGGYTKIEQRLNPKNPLSYVVVAVQIPAVLAVYGVHGLVTRLTNPFKYQ